MNKRLGSFLFLMFFSMLVLSFSYVNRSNWQHGKAPLYVKNTSLLLQSKGYVHRNENHFSLCHTKEPGASISLIHGDVIELNTLRTLVHRRLFYIQNPKNCTAAKKIICKPVNAGFGSTIHQLTFCLIAAYATERTLIIRPNRLKKRLETVFLPVSTNCTSIMNNTVTRTKTLKNIHAMQAISLSGMRYVELPDYMPFAIPADLADRLESVHVNPEIWWIGQFVDYLMRPNEDLMLHLRNQQEQLYFERPLIGLHIRRTDKIKEAKYFSLSEYMEPIEKWFKKHIHNNTQTRYIFIASDDQNVIQEAISTYRNYTFIHHKHTIADKFSLPSLKAIILDLHTLAMCDFVACTLSSNICRLVNELKGSRDGCAAYRLVSLDMDYFFNALQMRMNKRNPLQNIAVKFRGLKPIKDRTANPKRILFKTDRNKSRVVMPTYPKLIN